MGFIEVSEEVKRRLSSSAASNHRTLEPVTGVSLVSTSTSSSVRPASRAGEHGRKSASGARKTDFLRSIGAGRGPEGQQPGQGSPGAPYGPQLEPLERLYFDNSVSFQVSSHLGSTAYLVCRLRSIQVQQEQQLRISWVRNMQILTSGEFRYISDERFRPTHAPNTNDWILEIHNVSADDDGPYECQVNSEPKPASVRLHLHVIVASVEILEGAQTVVSEASQIRLTCRVDFTSGAPNESLQSGPEVGGFGGERTLSGQHYIYWYKDNVSLEYNNPRGGIHVERQETPSSLYSKLLIEDASHSDAGLYLCKILPELNDVQPAECQVLVEGSQFGGLGSSGAHSNRRPWASLATGSQHTIMFLSFLLYASSSYLAHLIR